MRQFRNKFQFVNRIVLHYISLTYSRKERRAILPFCEIYTAINLNIVVR